MIKDEGKLVNLDWKKIAMNYGPTFSIPIDKATATSFIKSCCFKIEIIKDMGPYHYLITATPQ
jgi:hypothetical protein